VAIQSPPAIRCAHPSYPWERPSGQLKNGDAPHLPHMHQAHDSAIAKIASPTRTACSATVPSMPRWEQRYAKRSVHVQPRDRRARRRRVFTAISASSGGSVFFSRRRPPSVGARANAPDFTKRHRADSSGRAALRAIVPAKSVRFNLLTLRHVRRRAAQIRRPFTKRRIMPPWKPEAGKGEFLDEPALNGPRARIAAAVDCERRVEATPPISRRGGTGRTAGGSVVPMSWSAWPDPYTVPADGTDVFKTFVIPIPVAAPRYATGGTSRPATRRHSRGPGCPSHAASTRCADLPSRGGYSGQHGARRCPSSWREDRVRLRRRGFA